jgi:hypothetical protein
MYFFKSLKMPTICTVLPNGSEIDKYFNSPDEIKQFEAIISQVIPKFIRAVKPTDLKWQDFLKVTLELCKILDKVQIDDCKRRIFTTIVMKGLILKSGNNGITSPTSRFIANQHMHFVYTQGYEIYKVTGCQESDIAICVTDNNQPIDGPPDAGYIESPPEIVPLDESSIVSVDTPIADVKITRAKKKTKK